MHWVSKPRWIPDLHALLPVCNGLKPWMVNGTCFYFREDVAKYISAAVEYCESIGPHSK